MCGQAVACEPGFILPRRYVLRLNGMQGKEGMFHPMVCDGFPTLETHEDERPTRC